MEWDEVLSSLPPEALQQLIQSGQGDEQLSMLQNQLQQAQGLRTPMTKDYGTGLGTGLGGAGNVIRNIAGMLKERGLHGQQQAVLGQQAQARGGLMQALAARLRAGQPQAPMGGGAGPQDDPMSMGY